MLSTEVLTADAVVAAALRVRRGTQVHEIRRLRTAEDEPISLHTSYVPRHLAAGLAGEDLVNLQLCQILEESYGLRMTKVKETLESAMASTQRPSSCECIGPRPYCCCTRKSPTSRSDISNSLASSFAVTKSESSSTMTSSPVQPSAGRRARPCPC